MNKKDLEQELKKKKSGVNEQVSEADAELNEAMPDEKVEDITKEVEVTVDENVADTEEVVNAEMNSEVTGTPGEVTKPKIKRKDYFGNPSVIEGTPSGVSMMGMNFMTGPTERRVINDIDQFERNTNKAQREFERVESRILREATQSVVTGENKVEVKGTPANNTIYPTESEITTETVSGKHATSAHSNVRMRENGTMMFSGINAPVFADTIVHSSGNEESQHSMKNLDQKVVLFNKMDQNGNVRKGFRHVRQGLYVIKGINPIMEASAAFSGGKNNTEEVIGYVRREDLLGDYQYVPVTESTHEMFRVQEITPVMTDITNAAEELVHELVANETRMKYGSHEQIQVEMVRIREAFNNVINTLNYPEFAEEDRSTLTKMEMGIFTVDDTDASLYNDFASYSALMKSFAQSEVLHSLTRLNVHNLKDNLKTFRGFEGKDPDYSYFRDVFKGDPHLADNYAYPTVADFAAEKGSSRTHDSLAKWIYGFSIFWRSLDNAIETFDNSTLKTNLLTKVKVSKHAFDDLVESLNIGRLSEKDGVTSAEILKLQDENAFVIGFNPNDLVSYSENSLERTVIRYQDGNESKTALLTKPFIGIGYLNVRSRETQVGSSSRYIVAPTWLTSLLKVFSNEQYLQLTLAGNKGLNTKALNYFRNWDNYVPWRLNLQTTDWIDLFILEGLVLTDSDVLEFDLPRNGFIRFLSYLEEAALLDKFYGDDSVSVNDVIDRIIGNDILWLKPFMNTPADFPVILDTVKERIDSEPFQNQIAVLGKTKYGKNTPEKSLVIMQPSRLDLDLFSLTDLRFYDPVINVNEDEITDVSELTYHIHPTVTNERYFRTLPTANEGEFLLTWRSGKGQGSSATLVTFERKLSESLNTAKRFLQLTEGADESILGWNTYPDKALFGKDGFQFIDQSDKYTIIINKGIKADGTIDERPFTWSFSLAPVYIYDDAQFKTAGQDATAYIEAPMIRYNVIGFNTLFNKVSDNEEYEPKSSSYSRLRSLGTNDEGTFLEAISVKRTALPSMYGHRRRVFRGLLDHTIISINGKYDHVNGYQGNAPYALKSLDASELFSDSMGHSYGLFPRSYVSYFPITHVGGGDTKLGISDIQSLSKSELADLFTAMGLEPGDPIYYDRQLTRYYNNPNVVTDSSKNITNLDKLIALHGFYANLNSVSNYEDFVPTGETDVYSDNLSQALAIKQITPIVNTVNLKGNYAIQDFIRRHLPNYYTSVIPSRLILLARYDSLTTDNAGLITINDHSLLTNNVMQSRFYINDYRDYVYQRPIISLNYRWWAPQIDQSAFADQYFNQVD